MIEFLDILNPEGKLILRQQISSDSVRKFSLMNEDSITLRFSSRESIPFPVGSSISDPILGEFYITQEQVGKWNAGSGVWDYELRFDAYYWIWANKILRYIINGINTPAETSFSLTATIDLHAQVILNCLKYLGLTYKGQDFRAATSDTSLSKEAKLVRYENLSILGGIQAIAAAWECEWWVEGNAICFGKYENPNQLNEYTFEAGINVSSISFNQGNSESPNRLYVFGSTRNLPTNYRKVDSSDTIGGVVLRRLMLPEGVPYLQTSPDIPEKEIVESVVVLDSVYPRTELQVVDTPEEYTPAVEEEEESHTYFRLRYGNSFHFSATYLLPNEELHIIFQSGRLNGMDFGAKFNPYGVNERNTDGSWNPEAQVIEIVANEDYGRFLPDKILCPQNGDEFILYGWDASKMQDLGLIAKAEQELKEEGEKALAEYAKDLSSCTCPMAWDYMKPLFEKNLQPKPGDSVTIIDTAHFGQGGRKSRILGYEYKLDKPYTDCVYTCGENISVKRLDSIERKIDGLAKSGEKVQLQNSLDFLSKRYADSTPYHLGVGSLSIGDYVQGLSGASVDGRGNGEFESLTVRSFLKVYELIYNRLNALEGEYAFCDSATIERVSAISSNSARLYLRKRWEGDFNAFQQGDIVYGYVNDLNASGIYAKAWGNVTKVERGEENYIEVTLYPSSEVDGGYNAPFTAEMVIARHGNSIEPNSTTASAYPQFIRESVTRPGTYINQRQSSFFISAPDGAIKYLHGVNAPKITSDNLGMVLGRIPEGLFSPESAIGQIASDGMPRVYAKGIITQEIIRTDYRGLPIRTQNYRGEWSARTASSPTEFYTSNNELYDLVTYDGILYMCVTPGTLLAPNPKNSDCGWVAVTDQRDVNVWSIGSNVDMLVKKLSKDGDEEILSPDKLTLTAILNTAGGVIEIDDPADLFHDYGMALYEDMPFGDDVADDTNFAVQDENGIKLNSELLWKTWQVGVENSVNPLYYGNSKTFLLVDLTNGHIVARKTIPVVSDGTDGKPGERGPMVYPAGEYNPETHYDSTSGASPVVLYDGQYFLLKPGNHWEREQTTPATDKRWELVDKFNTVFADILMANFAKLSSAVFYGEYMFSTNGTDSEGNSTSDYQKIEEYLDLLENPTSDDKVKYAFKPNYLLNLRTGQLWGSSLTAGNTVFGYEDVESEVGVFGSVTLDKSLANAIEFSVTGIDLGLTSANNYTQLTTGEQSLGEFTTTKEMAVKMKLGGRMELHSYLNDTNYKFATSVKVTFHVINKTTGDTAHSWSEEINDKSNNYGISYSAHTAFLSKGTYEVKSFYEIKFSAQGTYVPADKNRGWAIVKFTSFGIEVETQYRSMYGHNGFLLGDSATNYIIAIVDKNGGLNFTAENKNGYGLSLSSEGIKIKDGGAWQTLKDYIKANAK